MDSYENRNYEQEIDLKDLMFSVLRKWRPIILTAVFFAVLLGGYKVAKGIGQLQDSEFRKTNDEAYGMELDQYNTTKERLETEIENIQNNLKAQQEYKEDSILMNINPYDEHVAVTTLYIATDYQIMPDMVYQNPNTAASILQAYVSIAQNGEMYDYILGKMDNKMNLRYLKELVKVEPDYDNGMLSVTVTADTDKRAREVMGWIKDSISSSYETVAQSIGAHQVNVVDSSEYVNVDMELELLQKKFSDDMGLLDASLTEKSKNLTELKEPVNSLLSKTSILKSAVKYGVLGGVLGGFMAVFFICVAFLMSDNLVSEKELKRRYGVMVLGTFKKGGKKRAFVFVDRWLDNLEGVSKREMEDQEVCDVIAANAMNFAENVKSVLLLGTADSQDLNQVLNGLSGLLPGLSLSVGGNLCKNAQTIRETASCDAVIIVERRKASSFSAIEQELDLIKELNKKILGFVVL